MPNRSQQPPLATAPYGSLDVPLTVWTVENADDLVANLLTELSPNGAVAAVDLPGWPAVPANGRALELYCRHRSAAASTIAGLRPSYQRRTRCHSATSHTLAGMLCHGGPRFGMVAASSWLLRSRAGVQAAIDALKPEGFLVVLGETDRDAVDIATLTDANGATDTHLLSFTAYLVASIPRMLDAAAALNGLRPTDRPAKPSHWGVGIWRKCSADSLAGGGAGV